MSTDDDFPCKELVELVTDYLEGAMPPRERQRLEHHLTICDGCLTYIERIRSVIVLTENLRELPIEPPAKARLISAFRSWKQGGHRGSEP